MIVSWRVKPLQFAAGKGALCPKALRRAAPSKCAVRRACALHKGFLLYFCWVVDFYVAGRPQGVGCGHRRQFEVAAGARPPGGPFRLQAQLPACDEPGPLFGRNQMRVCTRPQTGRTFVSKLVSESVPPACESQVGRSTSRDRPVQSRPKCSPQDLRS